MQPEIGRECMHWRFRAGLRPIRRPLRSDGLWIERLRHLVHLRPNECTRVECNLKLAASACTGGFGPDSGRFADHSDRMAFGSNAFGISFISGRMNALALNAT